MKKKEICLLKCQQLIKANDKIIFKEWFMDNEFASENVTIFNDSKPYIDYFLKKFDMIPKIEILPEPSGCPIPNSKQMLLPVVNTLDKILLMDTKPNKEALKKEENKVGTIMDTLNEGITETKIIDSLISPEIKTDVDLDSVEFENDKKRKDFEGNKYGNIKKQKKSDNNNKYNSDKYNYLLKDETNETFEISVKHKGVSLKVEVKSKKKNDNDNNDDDDCTFLDKCHLHPLDRFRWKNKKDNVAFVKKTSQHPSDRLRRKQKLEFDSETLSEIPDISIDVLLDTKKASVCKNKIIDHIIKN